MRLLFLASIAMLAIGCGDRGAVPPGPSADIISGDSIPFEYAKTFRAVERDGYRIVDLKASIISWGGAAEGPKQHVRVVLVPKQRALPALEGDLAGALVIRTLLAAKPDVMFMAMGDVSHTGHMQRIQSFGVPVMPLFLDAEIDYMARVEYIRLVGMLTDREAEAERYVADVKSRVDYWKQLAARQPQKTVIAAWFSGSYVIERLRGAPGVECFTDQDEKRRGSLMRILVKGMSGEAVEKKLREQYGIWTFGRRGQYHNECVTEAAPAFTNISCHARAVDLVRM